MLRIWQVHFQQNIAIGLWRTEEVTVYNMTINTLAESIQLR